MKILCKSAQQIPASTQVKRVGKYLYKHLETSYDFNSGSNMYDVYFTLYYQKKHPKYGRTFHGGYCSISPRLCAICSVRPECAILRA